MPPMLPMLPEELGLGVGGTPVGDCWDMPEWPESFGSCEEPMVGDVIELPPARGRASECRGRSVGGGGPSGGEEST